MEDAFVKVFFDLLRAVDQGAFHLLPAQLDEATGIPSLLVLIQPLEKPGVRIWTSPGFDHPVPERIDPTGLSEGFPPPFHVFPLRHRDIHLGWWVLEKDPPTGFEGVVSYLALRRYEDLKERLEQKAQHIIRTLQEAIHGVRRKETRELFGKLLPREIEKIFPGVRAGYVRWGMRGLEICTPQTCVPLDRPEPLEFPEEIQILPGERLARWTGKEGLEVLGGSPEDAWLVLPVAVGPVREALLVGLRTPVHPFELQVFNRLLPVLEWARLSVQEMERTRLYVDQLERIVGLTRSFVSVSDRSSFLRLLLDILMEYCEAPHGVALAYHAQEGTLEGVEGRGRWTSLAGFRYPWLQGLAGHALNRGRIEISEDYEHDPRLKGSPYVRGLKWGMAIPLILPSGTPVGVIVIGAEHPPECVTDVFFLETMIRIAMQMYDRMQKDRELLRSYRDILNLLMRTLAVREHGTHEHTARVTALALALGKTLGLSDENLLTLYWGAMLHDIGKIGIPDHILQKPGPLTDEEWAVMRQHPVLGKEILQDLEFLRGALDVVVHHHERFDGKGYPKGLKGEEIPYLARIFSVADAFDAMISDRPYRKGMPVEEALRELARNRGSQFDPNIVDAFIQLLQERPELVENPNSVFESLSSVLQLYQLFLRR